VCHSAAIDQYLFTILDKPRLAGVNSRNDSQYQAQEKLLGLYVQKCKTGGFVLLCYVGSSPGE
jgi:hypothetical protein